MTIREAISAELLPFTVDANTITKACVDISLDPDAEYTVSARASVATAAVDILNRMLILASEDQGGYRQTYNIEGVKARIAAIVKANGLPDVASSSPTVNDSSSAW